jgi:hypothetical protein
MRNKVHVRAFSLKALPGLGRRASGLVDEDLAIALTIKNRDSRTNITTTLGSFVGVDPLPMLEVDIDAQMCSFEWKTFLDNLYGYYAFVGKLLCPWAPFQAVAGSFDRLSKEASSCIDELDTRQKVDLFCCTVRNDEDSVYQTAHIMCWRRANKYRERELSYMVQNGSLADKVAGIRKFRNAYVVRHAIEERCLDVSRVLEPKAYLSTIFLFHSALGRWESTQYSKEESRKVIACHITPREK